MSSGLLGLDEQTATNRDHIAAFERSKYLPAVIVAVVVLVVAVIVAIAASAPWFVYLVVVVAAAGVGAALLMSARSRLDRSFHDALSSVGGRELREDEFPRFDNLIEGLSISNGVDEPELFVLDAPGANLAVVARGDDAAVIATSGLLSGLGRVELEGVLAEALYRIKVRQAELATLVRGESKTERYPTVFASSQQFIADMSATSLTRYPPGLRDAFVKMSEIGTKVPSSTTGNNHLWICDPGGDSNSRSQREKIDAADSVHPPLQHRIDLLAEL